MWFDYDKNNVVMSSVVVVICLLTVTMKLAVQLFDSFSLFSKSVEHFILSFKHTFLSLFLRQ